MSDQDKGVVAARVPGPIGIQPAASPPGWNEVHHYKYPTKRKLHGRTTGKL